MGELQIANGAPSSEHSNVSPGRLEKTNVALRDSVLAGGPDSIVTGCGTSPISQLHSAGVSSTCSPSGVTARTSSSCSPSGRSG